MLAPVRQDIRINIMRAGFVATLPLIILASPHWSLGTPAHEMIETLGIGLLLTGVLGRFWATLYVGGRKNGRVVREGPYSLTRNPLYLFSTIAATGIGLMLGAVTFAVILGGLVFLIHHVTARREARYLEQEFGDDDRAYAREVPFLVPRLGGYRSAAWIDVNARALRVTLMDALVFLSFIPLVELLDTAKLALDLHLIEVF